MGLRGRVARAAAAAVTTGWCPGPGAVNRLAADGDTDPPPCQVCGGCHVLVIDEVVA